MISPQSFLGRLLMFSGTAIAMVFLMACIPQGGKEQRIKKSHNEAAHAHEEEPKAADAKPLKDCVETDQKQGLLVTDDHEEEGHDEEGHDEEGHDEEGHDEEGHEDEKPKDTVAKDPAKKEDCKKKETTPAKVPEEHDHDHE